MRSQRFSRFPQLLFALALAVSLPGMAAPLFDRVEGSFSTALSEAARSATVQVRRAPWTFPTWARFAIA